MKNLEVYLKLKNLILFIIEKEIKSIDETYFNLECWHTLFLTEKITNALFEYYSNGIEANLRSEFYRVVKNKLEKELTKPDNIDLKTFVTKEHIELKTGVQNNFLNNTLPKGLEISKVKKEHIADILFCAPVNIANQIFVGALKTNPKLTYNSFKYEINKIIEFITNHNFHFGLFLSVNTDADRMDGYKKLYHHRSPKRIRDQRVLKKITIVNYNSINKEFKIID